MQLLWVIEPLGAFGPVLFCPKGISHSRRQVASTAGLANTAAGSSCHRDEAPVQGAVGPGPFPVKSYKQKGLFHLPVRVVGTCSFRGAGN